ncbi:MAG: signal peptidase II [Candidatus Pacebacteria bacterium]|nr:signal peptidase II [Candidatus Paceibacterota bacterium]
MFLEYREQDLKKITAIALAVLFLDQVIKFVVVRNIFFEINIYKNYNALFGLPIDFNLVFVLFVALVFAYYFILQKEAELPIGSSASLGLIFGGIVGNLTDRIFYGYIIDYLNFFNLFVFNIADLAICFGVLLLSWKVLGK